MGPSKFTLCQVKYTSWSDGEQQYLLEKPSHEYSKHHQTFKLILQKIAYYVDQWPMLKMWLEIKVKQNQWFKLIFSGPNFYRKKKLLQGVTLSISLKWNKKVKKPKLFVHRITNLICTCMCVCFSYTNVYSQLQIRVRIKMGLFGFYGKHRELKFMFVNCSNETILNEDDIHVFSVST